MSDDGKKRGGGYVKWFFVSLACFVFASPFLGLFIDVFIIFRPSSDSLGHGAFFLTILFPIFAIIIAVIATIIFAVTMLIAKASHKRLPDRTYYEYQKYEYLKILQSCDSPQVPVMILHEIDPEAGRCSIRCIYIYQNGYVENFVNDGTYIPVPTVESMRASAATQGQSAYIITGWEFENMWNSGHCAQTKVL